MIFNSFAFALVFLPLAVLANLFAGRTRRLRTTVLLVASVVFYAYSSWATLPIVGVSLAMNFLFARRAREREPTSRSRWLMLGIAGNVTLLGICKYARFGIENLNALLGTHWPLPHFALPLGISFFTLQQVVFLLDCYEELETPAPLLDHALLIGFFPYISAGPIVKARDVFPALDPEKARPNFDVGLVRFVMGLTKKVAIADPCGRLADSVFGSDLPVGAVEAWVGALAFTLQLYFDFSGYTDMAIGAGHMLGFKLPENFDSPLKSRSIIEFWARWHITLSRFITTYLYTPLLKAFAPVTFTKAVTSTFVAMVIAGLWHGPAWTFVVFGALHGVALVLNQIVRKRKLKVPVELSRVLTFAFVMGAFVIFRATTLTHAQHLFASMLGSHGRGSLGGVLAAAGRIDEAVSLCSLLAGSAIAFGCPNSAALTKGFQPSARWAFACSVMCVLCLTLMNSSAGRGFIYRDF